MPKRGTHRPCPGCGEAVWRERAESVCRNCERLINAGRTFHETQAKSDDEVVVSFGAVSYANGYIRTRDRRANRGDELRDLLFNLASLLARPTGERPEFSLLGEVAHSNQAWLMPRVAAETIRAIRAAIVAGLEEEYQAGLAQGKNLLVQLADGEITLGQLEKGGKK